MEVRDFCLFTNSGNMTAEIYWFLYSGVQFSCYELFQYYNSNLVKSSFSSGALSSAVTTLVTYPFDIMRTRFVYQGNDKFYKHIATGIASIVRDEGLVGLYKGLFPCLLSIMPYMGACFYIVELLRSRCLCGSPLLSRWRHSSPELGVWRSLGDGEQGPRVPVGHGEEAAASV